MRNVTKINQMHIQAMELAEQAFDQKAKGKERKARNLFKQAYECEKVAATLISTMVDSEPSRSIILRSAATLALDCNLFRESERMISLALSGNPVESMAEELRNLLETVNLSRHLSLRGLRLNDTELQLTLMGDRVGFGLIESGEFIQRIETLERLLIRTVFRKLGKPLREGETKHKDYPMFCSMARAGSYALTLKVGSPMKQMKFAFADDSLPSGTEIISEVVDCIEMYSHGAVDFLRARISDEDYFNNFTALAKKLAPDGKRIRTVGITTFNQSNGERQLSLVKPNNSIWRNKREEATDKVFEGRVTSADESSTRGKHVFVVEGSDGKRSPSIHVQPGNLNDIVKPYWGEKVSVRVVKRKGRFEMTDLSPIYEDD